MIKTGYSVYKKGQLIQEYEFDSKSVDNIYYAFMHRHNSNRILPDPKIVHDFKMFSLGVINTWISNMRPVEEINIVSVHDFIKSKTGWEPNKKNRYLKNIERQLRKPKSANFRPVFTVMAKKGEVYQRGE